MACMDAYVHVRMVPSMSSLRAVAASMLSSDDKSLKGEVRLSAFDDNIDIQAFRQRIAQ